MYKFAFSPKIGAFISYEDIRVAVASYLLSRHLGGSLMLRLPGFPRFEAAEDDLLSILRWLEIDFDSMVRETERVYYYREVAIGLVEMGRAYRCFCVSDELTVYPECVGGCRMLSPEDSKRRAEDGEPFAIRLYVGESSIVLRDVVLGDAVVSGDTDFVLLYPDGMPSFGFASAIDDMDFSITHVVRSVTHVEYATEECFVSCAMGRVPPVFCHLPETSLSGAFGDTVLKGKIVPEALLDYMARQTFLIDGDEPLSREETIRLASFDRIRERAGAFDKEELESLNRKHVAALGDDRFYELVEYHCGFPVTFKERALLSRERDNLCDMDDVCKRIKDLRKS